MNLNFKRIKTWPSKLTPSSQRDRNPVPIPYDESIVELIKSLRGLGASSVYIGLGLRPFEMRQDGWPRANATPDFPGVYVVVDCDYGVLLFACDRYMNWLKNFRVVVEALSSLRRIVEDGLAKPEELYAPFRYKGLHEWLNDDNFFGNLSNPHVPAMWQGQSTYPPQSKAQASWSRSEKPREKASPKQPPRPEPPKPPKPPTSPPKPSAKEDFSTRVEAATWLASKTDTDKGELLFDYTAMLNAYRQAAKKLHPDVGGDPADFRRLQNAKTAIERGASWGK